MLRKFSVRNFKNFREELTLDFSLTRDYEFNKSLIKNGLVNKMLIYGRNNSGKSNLGAAIMDITTHLTDNLSDNILYSYYINGDYIDDIVTFSYEFLFGSQIVVYSYTKDSNRKLVTEELSSNGRLIFKQNYKTEAYVNNIPEAQTLDLRRNNTYLSVLKYIYNNTLYWNEDSPVRLLMEFVQNMLWFRSLKQNEFMGAMPGGELLDDFILNGNRINDFQTFLKGCGQDYRLCQLSEAGQNFLGVKFDHYVARFNTIASTGTLSLWLFYYWMNRKSDISFVFLDEFDAFYHFELSKYILEYINSKDNFQSVLTTHNTFLIDNELMRPDCYAILSEGKLRSFADSTNKAIRAGHNLEKMMLGGEFGS